MLMNMTSSNWSKNHFLGVVGLTFTLLLYVTTLIVSADAGSSYSSLRSSDSQFLNVYGQPLQSCSENGMALTGFTRSGYCVERTDDKGSHHICIDLSSTSDAENGYNFCQVTGQDNWCAYKDMPCHEDSSQSGCPVTNWCVCQWAFSSYVVASGCDQIQTIVCDSINLEALLAYQKMAAQPSSGETKYQLALECIVNRCGLDINNLPTGRSTFFSSVFNNNGTSLSLISGWWSVLAAFVIAGVALFMYHYNRGNKNGKGGDAAEHAGSYSLSK